MYDYCFMFKRISGNYKGIRNGIIREIKLANFDHIFHAVKIFNDKIISTGGRILNFTSLGKNYSNIEKNYL